MRSSVTHATRSRTQKAIVFPGTHAEPDHTQIHVLQGHTVVLEQSAVLTHTHTVVCVYVYTAYRKCMHDYTEYTKCATDTNFIT